MVAPPPAPEVVAESVSGLMAVPELSVCAPGSVTVTTLSMVQLNVADPWAPELSVATRVTTWP